LDRQPVSAVRDGQASNYSDGRPAASAAGPKCRGSCGSCARQPTSAPGSRAPKQAADPGRSLAGVRGGIAEFLNIDPSLARVAFVVGTSWGGIGVLAYIVRAIVLPVDQHPPAPVSLSGE
jgi:phage shock protein C